ncbi:MAG: hypothetical protein M3373_02615 [Gemmatimonadota bacterium]|nr:hypothetical protein [Gemmatimonadota bacterium]
MEFREVLALVAKEGERRELLEMAARYHESPVVDRRGGMEELMRWVGWHFRALRRPMPTETELEAMIERHFGGG